MCPADSPLVCCPIEGAASYPGLLADVRHGLICIVLEHVERHVQGILVNPWPSNGLSLSSRRFSSGTGVLVDAVALEFGDAGEYVEHEPARGRRGVYGLPLADERNAEAVKSGNQVEKVARVSAQPRKLRDVQLVPLAQPGEEVFEGGAFRVLARHLVDEHVSGVDICFLCVGELS